MLTIWILVFIVAIIALIKGADWLLDSAEKIGFALGLSSFIVGVIIVGLGTSFPELISSIAAVIEGATDIPAANAIGSNIANILLVVGLAAIVGRRLIVTKNLIDLDLPLLAVTTGIFLVVAWDKTINLTEAIILLATYLIYFIYTIKEADYNDDNIEPSDIIPPIIEAPKKSNKITIKDIVFLILGLLSLIFGAKFLIDAVIAISAILNIATGVIALAAVAFGTSLPEVIVSIKAAMNKKYEVALGNIFGSNIFNILVVVGIPGLFKTLTLDTQTFSLGIPMLIASTILFVISGISKHIHIWEGLLYVLLYALFIAKIFALI
ncbi:MAG: calcium/sodium antiporter [bacterium]|nr:calcium/sodium antiporter [bacterium]